MQIALWGLRGGVGTTSVTAMLADVLSRSGGSVLAVDMNPADMLRLHFGVPYGDERGWASTGTAPFWHQQTVTVSPSLTMLPYGYHRTARACHPDIAARGDSFWADYYPVLTQMYQWVLFDLPPGGNAYPHVRDASDLSLVVTGVDMASHILLEQAALPADAWILVNGLDPSRRLSSDILLAWRQSPHGAHLVPVWLHHDQHVHEAFAHKIPATARMTGSSAERDMTQLMQWCQGTCARRCRGTT